jgi:uncharacterized UPF0160 family protein
MEKTKTIVTHGANYHPDDLFAVATLLLVYKNIKCKVIRTLDPEIVKKGDIVLDTGGIYDAKKFRFDHHQQGGAGKRFNGIGYASFGLIWKHFGMKLCGNREVFEYVDNNLVSPLDATDSGIDLYESKFEDTQPFLLEDYIDLECIEQKNKTEKQRDFDGSFKKLIPFAQRVILLTIAKAKSRLKSKKIIEKAYVQSKDKRLVVHEKFVPFDFYEYPEILFRVYKDIRGMWCLKTINISSHSFASRKLLPKEWWGKRDGDLVHATGVADAIFCHNTGFLAVSKTKQGALDLANMALRD